MCSSQENADKLTKPSRGDHWINGLLLDGQDFEFPANFSNSFPIVFQVFPKNAASGAAPSSDNGTSNLMILLVKISSGRKSSLIFSLTLKVG